jgi:hypothetical protein
MQIDGYSLLALACRHVIHCNRLISAMNPSLSKQLASPGSYALPSLSKENYPRCSAGWAYVTSIVHLCRKCIIAPTISRDAWTGLACPFELHTRICIVMQTICSKNNPEGNRRRFRNVSKQKPFEICHPRNLHQLLVVGKSMASRKTLLCLPSPAVKRS